MKLTFVRLVATLLLSGQMLPALVVVGAARCDDALGALAERGALGLRLRTAQDRV